MMFSTVQRGATFTKHRLELITEMDVGGRHVCAVQNDTHVKVWFLKIDGAMHSEQRVPSAFLTRLSSVFSFCSSLTNMMQIYVKCGAFCARPDVCILYKLLVGKPSRFPEQIKITAVDNIAVVYSSAVAQPFLESEFDEYF